MNNYSGALAKEIFSRLFVIATNNKMNLLSFSTMLGKSDFVRHIEENRLDYIDCKSVLDIFYEITGFNVNNDDSFGVFNDAYWCGNAYYYLFSKTSKSFSYLFLKFPILKMFNAYSTYHEMDWSSLLEFFKEEENKETILRLLCKNSKVSLSALSGITGISKNTLLSYNKSDKNLYNASFKNVVVIAKHFDAPINLFIEKLELLKNNE